MSRKHHYKTYSYKSLQAKSTDVLYTIRNMVSMYDHRTRERASEIITERLEGC